MIEHLEFYVIEQRLEYFQKILSTYVVDPSCSIRQAAAYGIGLLAQKTPSDRFARLAGAIEQSCLQAIRIPRSKEKKKVFMNSLENCVSALGKLIKY